MLTCYTWVVNTQGGNAPHLLIIKSSNIVVNNTVPCPFKERFASHPNAIAAPMLIAQ